MDGSGKTTVSRMLAEELQSRGRRVLVLEHPNRDTVVGRLEARFLLVDGKMAMVASTCLYIADVIRSVWIMKHSRTDYDDVVFVRYIMAVSYLPDRLAGMAYTIFANVLPTPDVKILVDVDESIALERIDSRGEEKERFESLDKLRDTRRRMLDLSKGWIVIDNSGSSDDSRNEIHRIL